MGNFGNTLTQFVTNARGLVIAVVAVALLINGIMLAWPNERTKERAKEALPWVVIGCAVALSAVALAQALGNSF